MRAIRLVHICAQASAGIEMIVSTNGYTADLLTIGKVPLPIDFAFNVGNGADLLMHGGKLRGLLSIIAKEAEPDLYRCRWNCRGSQYDGREFLLSPGAISEISVNPSAAALLAEYQLLPR
ncbi:MAG: hypothetical protein ABWZ74_07475 [Hyphomicrobiaceae bacterium]